MTRLYAIIAVTLVAILLGGMSYFVLRGPNDDIFADCRHTKIAGGKAAIGGPFTLIDHNGNIVTETDVITKPSLVYFGYTFCPDVCPLDTARNAEVVDLLSEMGVDVTPIFITIDPERDTPEAMSDFVSYTHEKMIGLTGTETQVKAASKAYKTFYRKNGDGEDYLMDHSTFTYLVLPQHGFVEFFRRDMTPAKMADSVSCFASKT